MELITPADAAAAPSTGVGAELLPKRPGLGERLSAYLDLTKPRITVLVVLSAIAGFALGSSSPIDWIALAHTAFGVALLSSGIGTLNQYLERQLDALMQRTKNRPLPQGKLPARHALWFGLAIALIAELYLAYFVNPLAAACGLAALSSYLFLYTPLKTRSHWCTFVGAFPGAMPAVLGIAAARNQFGLEALVLFAIMFFWQFPHFHAIALMCRNDYARAGIRMLPVVEPDGRSTARQIVGYTLALVLVSLLPAYFKFSGMIYLAGAILFGAAFLYVSLLTARKMTHDNSRLLLKASVLYLPLLLGLMVLNR
ncbi:MAG: heme o synthase [Blastocatellia bacterium]|nr:heme o synthase [Blastocatellia bacterium]